MTAFWIFLVLVILLTVRYVIWYFGFYAFIPTTAGLNIYNGSILKIDGDYRTYKITGSTATCLTIRKVWRW